MPTHRRTVSLSSIQHSQAYILVPRPLPHPQVYQARSDVQPKPQTKGGEIGPPGQLYHQRRRPVALANIRHNSGSPPLTPIVESPLPIIPPFNTLSPAPVLVSRTPSPPQLHQAQAMPLSTTNLAKTQHHQLLFQRQHVLQQRHLAYLQQRQQQQTQKQLMLLTPTMAAYLNKGGSVNVKAPDGKSWKIRAPQMMVPSSVVSPTCGMRMIRMQ